MLQRHFALAHSTQRRTLGAPQMPAKLVPAQARNVFYNALIQKAPTIFPHTDAAGGTPGGGTDEDGAQSAHVTTIRLHDTYFTAGSPGEQLAKPETRRATS